MKQKGGQLSPFGRDYTDLYTNKEIIDMMRKFQSSHTMGAGDRLRKFGKSDIMNTDTHEHMTSLKDMIVSKILSDNPDKFDRINPASVDIDINYPSMPGKCTYKDSNGKLVRETCRTEDLPNNYNPDTGEHDSSQQKAPLIREGGSRKRSRYTLNIKNINRNMLHSRGGSTRKNNVSMRSKKGSKKRGKKRGKKGNKRY